MAEIRELNQKMDGFRILTGVEMDIRADGSLDMPDEILSQLDVVIASTHISQRQEKSVMMERLRKALSSPHIDILAHPTGRVLRERDPIDLDIQGLFRIALDTNTALEINCWPNRLDLRDVYIRRSRELGVRLSLGTDSHGHRSLST